MMQALIDVAAEGQTAQLAIFDRDAHPLLQWAASVTVTCKADADMVTAQVHKIDRVIKGLKGLLEPNIERLNADHKAAVRELKDRIEPLMAAKRGAGGKVLAWQDEEKRKAAEAQAQARAEAEAKAAAERKRLMDEAKLQQFMGDDKAAMAKTFEAAVVQAAPVVVEAAPKVKGLFSRKVPKVDILDMGAVPREYCEPSEHRLLSAWRASGHSPTFTVPGCKFHMDETVTTRT